MEFTGERIGLMPPLLGRLDVSLNMAQQHPLSHDSCRQDETAKHEDIEKSADFHGLATLHLPPVRKT